MNLFNNLERRVLKAKTDPAEADRLISDYRPFIARTVKDRLGRYEPQTDSDAFSAALSAFHEAINAYDPTKGKFLPFSAGVIRLRLIDLYRRQRRPETLSLDTEEAQEAGPLAAAAVSAYTAEEQVSQRRYEVLALTDALKAFGITFGQLAEHSPRQSALRMQYHQAVRRILEEPGLMERITESGRLPMKELETLCGMDRKRLDRGRIYIIACLLILAGDYPYLKEYIEWR